MTQFTLLIELMDIIKSLLETDVTSTNIYRARIQMDDIFDRFEEYDGVEISELGTILDKIAINILNMPSELKAYFKLIESFQSENEIYPHDLPNGANSFELAQFVTGFLTILNNLLEAGVTACNAHQARLQLDDLFQEFEQQAEENEDMLEDDTTDTLNHFFPNLELELYELTTFPV